MMSADATHALVRSLATYGLPGVATPFRSTPLDQHAWHQVLVGISRHRLLGLLAAAVDGGALPVDERQMEEVAGLHAEAMRKCLILESDLLRTSQMLGAADVDHSVLKGPSFAHLDYVDPSWRVFGDIDLLVRSRDFDRAVDALRSHGYRRRHREVRAGFDRRFGKGSCLESPDGREIDLHRTFVSGAYGLSIHLDDLWTGTVPLELGGERLQALRPECRILHAAYHAALGNRTPPLLPLRDLAGMLTNDVHPSDHAPLLDLARRWGGEAVLARGIRLAWDGLELPPSEISTWATGFRPGPSDERALRTYLDPDLGYAARQFTALRAVPGLRDKASFAWGMLVPDRAYGPGRHGARRRRLVSAARQIFLLFRRRPPSTGEPDEPVRHQ